MWCILDLLQSSFPLRTRACLKRKSSPVEYQALNHIGSNYTKRKSLPPCRNLAHCAQHRHHKEDFARHSSPGWDEWFICEVLTLTGSDCLSWILSHEYLKLQSQGQNIPSCAQCYQWLFMVGNRCISRASNSHDGNWLINMFVTVSHDCKFVIIWLQGCICK